MSEINDNQQIQKDIQNNMVQIWLDSYDDMFSDFDPRPYSLRMWSDDFIFQIKKAVKEHAKKVSVLRILIPPKVKNKKVEEIVINRLLIFFKQGRLEEQENKKKAIHKGIIYVVLGTFVMLLIEYLQFRNKKDFSWHLFLQIFEPLGWFLLWAGLDTIVNFRKTLHDLKFYSKLANSKIEFTVY